MIAHEFSSIYAQKTAPKQRNGHDCGVFTCQTLEHRGRGVGDGTEGLAGNSFEFQQEHIDDIRKVMIWEIAHAKLRERDSS
jgi:sentrin-specific protease 1